MTTILLLPLFGFFIAFISVSLFRLSKELEKADERLAKLNEHHLRRYCELNEEHMRLGTLYLEKLREEKKV